MKFLLFHHFIGSGNKRNSMEMKKVKNIYDAIRL
jgi:hypothetical protein